jgi:K+-transporting ATPase ATPase C chain
MHRELWPALRMLLILTLLTGVLYPLLVTGIAQGLFPEKANGSLITQDGRVVGSGLIGQPFSDPTYFWGRPSVTTPMPYNAASAGGSNLGPTNPALEAAVRARIAALEAGDPGNRAPIPVDLVTASASGLDPDLSPAGALYQVGRVARARHLSPDRVRALVARYTQGRALGILGEARVNVLALNRALDAMRGG